MVYKKRKLSYIKCFSILVLFVLALQCRATTGQVLSADKGNSGSGSSKVFMRGLYIPNHHSRSMKYIKSLVEKSKDYGINMFVFDVHPYGTKTLRVNKSVIEFLKNEKIYIAGRIVCFQDGIDRLPVPAGQLKLLTQLVTSAADSGFDEIQLDYIRFIDGGKPYPLKKKYAFIEELLKSFREITDERKIKLSADVFGRIVYNHDDLIGQKLELFASYAHVIYPMLYPSHFNMDRQKMSQPGVTMKEGADKGLLRLEGTGVYLQPYIQAFPYNIQYARVKLDKYVALQIKAVEETKARGWVAWNPNGDYSSVFSALNIIKTGLTVKNM